MDTGFGDDESYNVYDKPWRDSNSLASHIYRPGKNIDKEIYGDDLQTIINTNRLFLLISLLKESDLKKKIWNENCLCLLAAGQRKNKHLYYS